MVELAVLEVSVVEKVELEDKDQHQPVALLEVDLVPVVMAAVKAVPVDLDLQAV